MPGERSNNTSMKLIRIRIVLDAIVNDRYASRKMEQQAARDAIKALNEYEEATHAR